MTENTVGPPRAEWIAIAQDSLYGIAQVIIKQTTPNFDSLSVQDRNNALALTDDMVYHLAALTAPLDVFVSHLKTKTEEAAQQIVESGKPNLSPAEHKAVVVEQQLKIISGLQLEINLLMGDVLNEADIASTWKSHPSIKSFSELLAEVGLSASESSDYIAISTIIFPWLEEMGLNPREMWQRIGKSKFRRIVPLLRAILNPAASSPSVHKQVNDIRERLEREEGDEVSDDALGLHILSEAETHSLRNLDQNLRGDESMPIAFIGTQRGDDVHIRSDMGVDQLDLLRKRMYQHAEFYIDREPDLEVKDATVSIL